MTDMVEQVVKKMIEYFGKDVKRINHAIKVYTFASNIGRLENLAQREITVLEIASVLHDIGIKKSELKYNSSAGKYQEIEGPPVARKILKPFGLKKDVIDRVCYLIGNHHTCNKIDGIDFQILVEADFIVNIYEDNLGKEQINNIYNRYFKTRTGREYFKSMFIN